MSTAIAVIRPRAASAIVAGSVMLATCDAASGEPAQSPSARAAVQPAGSTLGADASRKVAAFPGPRFRHASPTTGITFRGVEPDRLGGVRVTGSSTGRHAGSLRPLRVARGAVFTPDERFAAGERVTVELGRRVRTADGRSYTFRVAEQLGVPWKSPLAPELLTHRAGEPCPMRDIPLHSLDLPTPDQFCLQRRAGFRDRSQRLLVGVRVRNDARFVRHALLILSGRGQLLWYRPYDTVVHDLKVVRYRDRPALAYYVRAAGPDYHQLLDHRYRPIRRVYPGNGFPANAHEFAMTGNDTAYIGMYVPVRQPTTGIEVTDFVVQEIDVVTGDVLFEWHALDHVPLSASYAVRPSDWPWDYFHGNSIEPPRRGRHTIVVSARKTSAVYGIDRRTGGVRWILGGKQDQFGVAGRRGRQFCAQHDARWVGKRDLSVFDNGGWALRGGCPDHRARVLRFRLDTGRKTAQLVRRVGSGPSSDDGQGYHPVAVGSARWHRDGALLVNWGNSGRITEVAPSGRVRFKLQLRHWTYRAVSATWDGRPTGHPAVAAQRRGHDRIDAWASWNGATGIKAWQALAGDDAASMAPIGPRVAFAGLETRLPLRTSAAHVAVQALDRAGRVLGRSQTIPVRPAGAAR